MKLLHVDSGREMRGGQWQTLYLAGELTSRDYDIKLLCNEPLRAAAEGQGISTGDISVGAIFRGSRSADAIHVHDAHSHTLAAFALSTASAAPPLIVARRVAFPVSGSAPSRWKYRQAARFIAVSQFVKERLLEARIPSDKIDVVYDGVPVPSEVMEYGRRDPKRIISILSKDSQKGTKLLLDVSRRTGLAVHCSGALWDDLPTAGLFVYLTQAEGLGSAALLAMSNGVPVVASRVGGLPEIVQHESTGLLTENEPEAVAAAIQRVLGDRELAARLSAEGRSAVENRYSIRSMADATIEVYRKVLSQ